MAAREAGWDQVLLQDPELTAAATEIAEGGYDVILDPTGTLSLELDLAIAAPGARIVLFGNTSGGTPEPLPTFGQLLGGNIGLIGFSITTLRRTHPVGVVDALTTGLAMLNDGQVRPPVTVVESLDDVGTTHDLLANRSGAGKYVVRVTESDHFDAPAIG